MLLSMPKLNVIIWLLPFFFFSLFSSPAMVFSAEPIEGEVVVLAVNDVYRIEGVGGGQQGGLAFVRALRRELEKENSGVLFLHAGDFLFPSLLSEWTQGAHMIEMMNALDGAPGVFDPRMFVVFGNHEFDKSEQKHAALLQARINQSEFHWLGSNIRFTQEEGKPLVGSDKVQVSRLVKSGGIRVGIFGLTTDRSPASTIAYVDEFLNPVQVAEAQTTLLRAQEADVVIALTHLALEKDREILETLGERGPDLIIGGHEHQRHHVEIGGRWILKADADARTATVVRIRIIREKPFISFGYRFLDRERLNPDPEMQKHVDQTLKEHEEWFCAEHREETGCLHQPVGETGVALHGEELEIRSYETNLGNWVADQVRAAVENADIAFINAGSLRINRDIPPGPILQRDVEELLPYNSELVQVELDRYQLDTVLERATEDWSGKGHWLQVSGFAFQHDPRKPEGQRVDAISLLQNGKVMKLPVRPLQVITYKYLLDGGDGYDMLKPLKGVAIEGSLKERLHQTLRASTKAIHPKVDGRICNLGELGHRPCAFQQPIP